MVKLLAERVLCEDDKLLFASCESNLLFSMNIISGNVGIEGFVRCEEMLKDRLFGGLISYRDKYVLIPANSKHVVVLDKFFNEVSALEIDEQSKQPKYMAGTIYNDNLFLFNHVAQGIQCINMLDATKTTLGEIGDDYFFSCLIEDSKVLLPSCKSNNVYIIDMASLSVDKLEIGQGKYNALEKYDDEYYFAPRGGDYLTIWTIDKGIKEIPIPKCNAVGVFKIGDSVVLPSNMQGQSMQICVDGSVKGWHSEERFILAQRVCDNKYVLMNDDAVVYILDLDNGNTIAYNAELNDTSIIEREMEQRGLGEFKLVNECKINTLSVFLKVLANT